jgi:hypothetical protein
MNTIGHRGTAEDGGERSGALGGAVLLLQGVRIVVFAVLAALEPVIRVVLSVISLGGFAACAFYAWFAPPTHFPMGLGLSIASGAAVLLALYYLAMRALAP